MNTGLHRKTIKRVMRNKIDKLIRSVVDEDVKAAMKRDVLVTGGAIASMFAGEKVNDFDIYFRTFDTAKLVAEYYVKVFNESRKKTDQIEYTPEVRVEDRPNIKGENEKRILIYMKSAGVAGTEQESYKYFEHGPEHETEGFATSVFHGEDPIEATREAADLVVSQSTQKQVSGFKPLFLTDNAISLTDQTQLIIRFYGSPEEIHKNYDFIHCTGVYDYSADTLAISQEALESIMAKVLVYNGSLYPMASVLRIRKFIKRGWRINAGQIILMLEQVSHIDFNNPEVLKEQLMGVDVAYMHELISALNAREPGQRIDGTYLAQIIDQIFED